jgi:hypothetical protein
VAASVVSDEDGSFATGSSGCSYVSFPLSAPSALGGSCFLEFFRSPV